MSPTLTFYDAVRENTGAHFLDSGGAYGRHHEQPPVTEQVPDVTWDRVFMDCSATLSTAHFLAEALEIRDDMMAEFATWSQDRDGSWFELGDQFMRARSYVNRARDNVTNVENDLSQVYVWEAWTTPEGAEADGGDWIYTTEGAIAVVYVHTGCDVRGGYTRPYFCESRGEYAVPMDLSAEYRIVASHTLPESQWREIDDEWENGYSAHPFGQVEKRVKRWFPWASGIATRVALLDTGDVVRIEAYAPFVG